MCSKILKNVQNVKFMLFFNNKHDLKTSIIISIEIISCLAWPVKKEIQYHIVHKVLRLQFAHRPKCSESNLRRIKA